jgi:hypothetical protein
MYSKMELPDLVGGALEEFKAEIRPGDVFTNEQIAQKIERLTGGPLPDGVVEDIRQEMMRRQAAGLGVEAFTTTGSAWRFGNARPAQSQQIPVSV